MGAKTAHIEPGSPCENGYVESFNGKLRDELLNAEVFNTLLEGLVTAKLCGLATALQNTRSVKSAGPDPQQNRGFRHHSPTMPNGEV